MKNVIINWFKKQSTKTKVLMVVGSIALLVILVFAGKAAYWKYQYFKELETQFKAIEKENKSLLKDVKDLERERNDRDKIIAEKNKAYEELKKKIKPIQNEKDKIPDAVASWPDRKLDSILLNHKHLKNRE